MQDDEIIFMLTPHVVRATDISPLNLQEIDTGTGTNVELRRISAPANPQAGWSRYSAARVAATCLGTARCRRPAANGTPRIRSALRRRPPAVSSSVTLQIAPPQTAPKVGGTFQVAVNLSGGQDVFSVPMQLHYDNSKLALINVDTGIISAMMARPSRWFIATMGLAMS